MINEINQDSAIFKLLLAKGKKDPHYAWYPTSIDTLRNRLNKYVVYDVNDKQVEATVSNICYSFQFVELLIRLHNDIYLSNVIHRIINKQIVITIAELEQALLEVHDGRLFGKQISDASGKKHNLSFDFRIDKAKEFGEITNNLCKVLKSQKAYRNKVHLRSQLNDNEVLSDYSSSPSDNEVNKYVKNFNLLLEKISDVNIKIQLSGVDVVD